MNGSTVLKSVEVALVLGVEEEHAFQYLPGESNETVWPGKYEEMEPFMSVRSSNYMLHNS